MANICEAELIYLKSYRSIFPPTDRSNGIVNVGFVMYHSMKTVATETILFVRSGKKAKKGLKEAKRGHENNGHHPIAVEDPIAILWRIASGTLVPGMVNIVLTVTPFAAFQGIELVQQDSTSENQPDKHVCILEWFQVH